MSENWKPGDVGSIDTRGEDSRVMFTGYHWVSASGELLNPHLVPRRLVTIDHEDREQVERLDALIDHALSDFPEFSGPADCLQAALREFANPTPPKPEEPTGLGAVVEDADGFDWHLSRNGKWLRLGPVRPEWRNWSAIAAVRVLSLGVTP